MDSNANDFSHASHANGTRSVSAPAAFQEPPAYTQIDIDRLTDAHTSLSWDDLLYEDQLEVILSTHDPVAWLTHRQFLTTLQSFRKVPWEWALIRAVYRKIGGEPYHLEKAIDALIQASKRAETSSTTHETPEEMPRFQTISARDLYAKDLSDLEYIIEGIAPAGAILFTGRGKDGKSLLAWNLCLSVATGGTALGHYGVQQGDVLYLALEDGERRAKKRLIEQMHHANMQTPPERLDLVLWDAPRVGHGFEERLLTWLDEHPEARLVVIDILEKVRPPRQPHESIYSADYRALAPLQRLAQDRNIAILIVHHSNKTKPEDFRDSASGSMGLIGACDTFWSLQRLAGEADAALHIIGRDVDAQEIALQFKDGFWTALGNAEDYRLSQASKAVLEVLRDAGKPCTPADLAKALDTPRDTMKKRLLRMADRGEILNIGDGRYIPRASPSPPPSHDEGGGESRSVPGVPGVPPVPAVSSVPDHGQARRQGGDTPPVPDPDPSSFKSLDVTGTAGTGGTPGTVQALPPEGVAPPLLRWARDAGKAGDICPGCRQSDWRLGVTSRHCRSCGYDDGPKLQHLQRPGASGEQGRAQ
jgi:hypothetical protein